MGHTANIKVNVSCPLIYSSITIDPTSNLAVKDVSDTSALTF